MDRISQQKLTNPHSEMPLLNTLFSKTDRLSVTKQFQNKQSTQWKHLINGYFEPCIQIQCFSLPFNHTQNMCLRSKHCPHAQDLSQFERVSSRHFNLSDQNTMKIAISNQNTLQKKRKKKKFFIFRHQKAQFQMTHCLKEKHHDNLTIFRGE